VKVEKVVKLKKEDRGEERKNMNIMMKLVKVLVVHGRLVVTHNKSQGPQAGLWPSLNT
jgi:hypothetical protein